MITKENIEQLIENKEILIPQSKEEQEIVLDYVDSFTSLISKLKLKDNVDRDEFQKLDYIDVASGHVYGNTIDIFEEMNTAYVDFEFKSIQEEFGDIFKNYLYEFQQNFKLMRSEKEYDKSFIWYAVELYKGL